MATFTLFPLASTTAIACKASRPTALNARAVSVLPHVSCSVAPVAQPQRRHHRTFQAQALPSETPQQAPQQGEQEEQFEGLLPEEDEQVPGNYADAMNVQSKLGKAIKSACKELSSLNSLEMSNLQQADALLKKLGFKSSLLPTDLPEFVDEEDEEDTTTDSTGEPTPEQAKQA